MGLKYKNMLTLSPHWFWLQTPHSAFWTAFSSSWGPDLWISWRTPLWSDDEQTQLKQTTFLKWTRAELCEPHESLFNLFHPFRFRGFHTGILRLNHQTSLIVSVNITTEQIFFSDYYEITRDINLTLTSFRDIGVYSFEKDTDTV